VNAGAALVQRAQQAQRLDLSMPSRLFWYYNVRVLEGTAGVDSGGQLRDMVKALARQGVCPESEYPYLVSRFARKPPKRCYRHAAEHQAIRYMRVPQEKDSLRAAVAAGKPVAFGMTVYESFESEAVARTGKVPVPARTERDVGGHAMAIVGYDERRVAYLVRNSWGTAWGDPRFPGHCWIPYEVILSPQIASDFWVIEQVEAA
jgi:C1A family cysteine protease